MATDKSGPWRPSNGKTRTAFVVVLTMIVAFGMAAPAIAATTNDPVSDHLNMTPWDEEETAPNPVIDADVTTAGQDLSEGTSHAAIAGYEDNDGDWVAGSDTPFVVNTTHDIDTGDNVNPYSFSPGHIEDASYTAFPDKSGRTWVNSSRWSTGGANSSLASAASNTTVESGVDAVRFNTGGGDMTTGDTAHWNFSAWDGELDSDESKRVLQIAMDVDSLEADTNVSVRVYDESDDYKEVTLNQSENAPSGNNFANSTGNSKVFQIKLNKLTTNGGGSWDNIEKVQIRVTDGDADVSVSWLDLRRKGRITLAEQRATTNDDGNDPDSDGDYDEIQTVYNATGDISTHSMETLDTEYDDAVVHDLSYPARYQADGLDEQGEDGEYAIYWEENENPGFANVLNVTYSLELPNAIDLSYSNTDVVMTQKWTDGRYLALEQASGVADSTNLSDASYSTVSTVSKGEEVTIQGSSVDAGERFLVHYELELTSEERDMVEAAAGDGGAGAPVTDGGGGIIGSAISFVTNPLGAVISIIVGLFAFSRFRR